MLLKVPQSQVPFIARLFLEREVKLCETKTARFSALQTESFELASKKLNPDQEELTVCLWCQ